MKEIYLSETSKRKLYSGKCAISTLFFLFMLSFIFELLIGLKYSNYLLVLYNSVLSLFCLIILGDNLLLLKALITGRYKSFCVDITRVERASKYSSRVYWGNAITDSVTVNNFIVASVYKEKKVLVIQYSNNKRKSFVYSKYVK